MIGLVALGAALGGVTRFELSHLINRFNRSFFPWATWVINLSGSFFLGLLFGLALPAGQYALLGTGFCGGYTTFSTFNSEWLNLMRRHDYLRGLLYGLSSYVLGPILALIGWLIVQGR